MFEWKTLFKILFVSTLLCFLIFIIMSLLVMSNWPEKKVSEKVLPISNLANKFDEFDMVWLDRANTFQFACNCIGKPIELKIKTGDKIVNIDLSQLSASRRSINKALSQPRYQIKINNKETKIEILLDS